MIAAILIWASQTKAVEGPKENNNNEPLNYVTRTTFQQVQQYIPEFFIMAWLCGNILVHKFLISVLNLKTADFHLFMSKSVQTVKYKHTHPC
jgi:hypothetical protein